ncbi:hypothetical protein Pyn_31044 [Prunus yedoensis var. nudiflora]|uniref:Uncharacterized protein n=1 Tax=Prunus yedoensis var. nudiflora TaxID=2094558 RepID=A0A314Z7U0_PRUYE|nr:hypothetical protein Pyn_31044 [Prunus yedoensis var. nudiflora]
MNAFVRTMVPIDEAWGRNVMKGKAGFIGNGVSQLGLPTAWWSMQENSRYGVASERLCQLRKPKPANQVFQLL